MAEHSIRASVLPALGLVNELRTGDVYFVRSLFRRTSTFLAIDIANQAHVRQCRGCMQANGVLAVEDTHKLEVLDNRITSLLLVHGSSSP